MQNSDDFVAVIAILVIFGLPLAYAIASRFFAHQERLAMIQRGIVPPPDARGWRNQQFAGPQPAYDPYGFSEWQAQRSLRKGITVAMVGFALLVGLSFINPGRPGPWLLGGLIPLFVGIAQIISAILAGARLGPLGLGGPPPGPGVNQQQPGAQQYQQPPPFTAGRDVPPGPYAWRPGPTTELEKPTRPPDVKQ